MHNLPVAFLQVIDGAGKPFARHCSATEPPSETFLSVGSTNHDGGTVEDHYKLITRVKNIFILNNLLGNSLIF